MCTVPVCVVQTTAGPPNSSGCVGECKFAIAVIFSGISYPLCVRVRNSIVWTPNGGIVHACAACNVATIVGEISATVCQSFLVLVNANLSFVGSKMIPNCLIASMPKMAS